MSLPLPLPLRQPADQVLKHLPWRIGPQSGVVQGSGSRRAPAAERPRARAAPRWRGAAAPPFPARPPSEPRPPPRPPRAAPRLLAQPPPPPLPSPSFSAPPLPSCPPPAMHTADPQHPCLLMELNPICLRGREGNLQTKLTTGTPPNRAVLHDTYIYS